MPLTSLKYMNGIGLAIAMVLASTAAHAQTRGPGTVGYTAAERREVERRHAAEFGLTNRAIQSAISSLGFANFNAKNPQHREQLRIKLRTLANLRDGQFNVLNRSALISANPSLSKQARAAFASFDAGEIQQAINKLLVLHGSLLTFTNGIDDYRIVTQLIASLYRSSGRPRLADELLSKCNANAAWVQSKNKWLPIMCTAQTAISRAVANGAPGDLKLALATISQSASLYQDASDSQTLPWEIERDLFEAAALNLVYEAPNETTNEVVSLGEKLLKSYEGMPLDNAYIELQAVLAVFYVYAANFGEKPEHFLRAQELISDLSLSASAPNYLRYQAASAKCAITAARYSQGLMPDPSALSFCENALLVAEQSGFTADCIIEAQLQALEAYVTLAAISTDGQAKKASYDLQNRIFENDEKSFTTWSPLQRARLEYLIARQGMQMLDSLPPLIAMVSSAQVHAIDRGFAKSRPLLFDASYNPYWQPWAFAFIVHQLQTNLRQSQLTFVDGTALNQPSAATRRTTSAEVINQLRKGYGAQMPARMQAVLEYFNTGLALYGEGQPADTIVKRILVHEERLLDAATQNSDIHIYDRISLLILLTTLKERGSKIDTARIEPHLSIIKKWQAGPQASTIPVPSGLLPWINRTFGLAQASDTVPSQPVSIQYTLPEQFHETPKLSQ